MDWLKFRPLYFSISGIALSCAVYAIFTWGFKPSIDFTGGSVVEYKFEKSTTVQQVKEVVSQKEKGLKAQDAKGISADSVQLTFNPDFQSANAGKLATDLSEGLGERVEMVRFENVGPVLSQEILKKTYIAVGLAALGILLLIAIQFKNFKFGVFAIIALLHDLTILLGTFAALGHFKGVEVNILVVTAFLTTLSLSLYDTIIVYDRIRESMLKYSNVPFGVLANRSVTETIVRSASTSLAASFLLLALFLFGGESIRWFVLALLIGTISGTYSSPFVAVPLILTWEELQRRIKRV